MRRTLHTTAVALAWLIERGVPVTARAEWQENSAKPCDTGTSPSDLATQYPFDFSSCDPIYPNKTGLYAYTQIAVLERGVFAKQWLLSRPERVIAVVTHSAFLRTAVTHARYANADYRVFDFPQEQQSVELVEWDLTESLGGGMGRSIKGRMTIEEGDFEDAEQELAKRPEDNRD